MTFPREVGSRKLGENLLIKWICGCVNILEEPRWLKQRIYVVQMELSECLHPKVVDKNMLQFI